MRVIVLAVLFSLAPFLPVLAARKGEACVSAQCKRMTACESLWKTYRAHRPGRSVDRQTYLAGCLRRVRID